MRALTALSITRAAATFGPKWALNGSLASLRRPSTEVAPSLLLSFPSIGHDYIVTAGQNWQAFCVHVRIGAHKSCFFMGQTVSSLSLFPAPELKPFRLSIARSVSFVMTLTFEARSQSQMQILSGASHSTGDRGPKLSWPKTVLGHALRQHE